MSTNTQQSIRLPNGLKVICNPMSDVKDEVNISFVFNCGSSSDGVLPGISHLAEHMVFRGTHKTPHMTSALGGLGNDYSAYTTYDTTAFYLNTDKNKISDAISTFVEMFTQSSLAGFETEKNVIKHELNLYINSPTWNLSEQINSAYGIANSNLLHKQTLPVIAKEDVKKFIENNYVPNNCTLILSGELDDLDILEATIKSKTKTWLPQATTFLSDPANPAIAKYTSGCFIKDAPIESTYAALFFEGAPSSKPKEVAIQYLADALVRRGFDSPLTQDARVEKGLAYYVKTWPIMERDHGAWVIESATDKTSLKDLVLSEMRCVKSLANSINNDSVALARMALKNWLNEEVDTPLAMTNETMYFNKLGVSKSDCIQILDEITTAEVKAWFDKTTSACPSLAVYGPCDEGISTELAQLWDSL